MSAIVPLGETALFVCVSKGNALSWAINGQLQHVPASKERGVKVLYDNTSFPVLKSNLTIPGTLENDNLSIQCVLSFPPDVVHSPVVFLTVLGKLCMVKK